MTLANLNFNCMPKLSLMNQDFEVLVTFESDSEYIANIDVNVKFVIN